MSVWRNDIERAAFRETYCDRCFEPAEAARRVLDVGPGCPHLIKAEENNVSLPKAWERRRNAVLGETFKCSEFSSQPKVNRRKTSPAETPPMFDADKEDVGFVPVDGWPSAADFGKEKKSKDDHA